ncbi:MAG TPA: hypothetical protein VJT71_18350 [Pyrinomonadaceae bacterium]|nr:hypothetical protein [Pyrinomonadaceae bacterium]
MQRRRIATIFLLIAFLMSAWSSVIAASLCPHYSTRDGSITEAIEQTAPPSSESCHHESAEMDTESEATTSAPAADKNQSDLQSALDLPDETCGHCSMHSQPSSGAGAIAALSSLPQSVETDAPPVVSREVRPFTFIIPITPFEHSPPGDLPSRHVLISVFRI